jgi:hypothetical protein
VATDTFQTFAELARLNDEKAERFTKFIRMWTAQKDLSSSYIAEWANRFRKEVEYEYADDERLKLLIDIDGVAGAKQRMRRVGQKNNWSQAQFEREIDRIDTIASETVARKSKCGRPFINLKPSTTTAKRAAKNILNMGKQPKIKL